MAEEILASVQVRRDSKANWESVNPILLNGEAAYEQDTDMFKIGDGVKRYSDLPYHNKVGPQGPQGEPGPTPQISMNVSTGNPGTSASVSVTGTAENPVINLTVPRGDTGETGSIGPKGDTGSSGVYIGTSQPTDSNINIWIDSDGEPTEVIDDFAREEIGSLKDDITTEVARAKAEEKRIEDLFVMPTQEAVNAWLDKHPEATTTVQDNSLTIDKMVVGTLGYVTPEMYGALCDGETDDTEAINAMFENVADVGQIIFPYGVTFNITKQLVVTGKKNLTIDFAGCVFKPANEFVSTNIPGVDANTMFCVYSCDNIVIRNAVFDCDTWNNGFTSFNGMVLKNSISHIEKCEFRNADYHQLIAKNGYMTGENLIFKNLGNYAGMSDVYTSCDIDGSIETHWRNIKSERTTRNEGQVFYFGVTSDTQKNYHTIDGVEAKNCGPVFDLRGGKGYFRNIVGERCGNLITQITGSVTESNAPDITVENMCITDVLLYGQAAPILITAARKAHLNNITVSLSVENTTNVARFIEVKGKTSSVKDVYISNAVYKGGYSLWSGIVIEKDVSCLIENVTIEATPTGNGMYLDSVSGEVKIVNYNCPKKSINDTNTSTTNISMKNYYRNMGSTAERPTPFKYENVLYYDTDLQSFVMWNGTKWTTLNATLIN